MCLAIICNRKTFSEKRGMEIAHSSGQVKTKFIHPFKEIGKNFPMGCKGSAVRSV
jgi:hypothetical protein